MNQSSSILSLVKTKSWLFGLAVGVSGAVSLALFVTAWEWLENPGGIFHGPEGTNWRFFWDTAISWLVPVFLCITLIAIAGHLLYSVLKRRNRK